MSRQSEFPFLQNLCIASAYRPVHELLEEEKKVNNSIIMEIMWSLIFTNFNIFCREVRVAKIRV